MTRLVACDLETGGLDRNGHPVLEVALIVVDGNDAPEEHKWWIADADLAACDATALRINRYYQREPADSQKTPAAEVARQVAKLTAGAHIVGANPAFDQAFLERMLKENGYTLAAHYHLVDVEAMAAAKLGIQPPWTSDQLAEQMGVEKGEKHTAIGDARWALRMYRAIYGIDQPKPAKKAPAAKKAAKSNKAAGSTKAAATEREPEPDEAVEDTPEPAGEEPKREMPDPDETVNCEDCGKETSGTEAQFTWARSRKKLCLSCLKEWKP